MPWNLLLLPLLGGFWFVSIFYPTRFSAIQASRDRLFFYSATAGLGLAVGARLLVIAVFCLQPYLPLFLANFSAWLKTQFVPWPYSGTAVLACVLGPFLAQGLNLCMRRKRFGRWRITADEKLKVRDFANEKALLQSGDQFERKVTTWMQKADLVIITLKNGKVYVAVVTEAPANIDGRCPWITITPYFSGYRDPSTKKVTLDTSYIDVIDKYVDDSKADGSELPNLVDDDFLRIVRADDIESAGKFNPDIWNKFQTLKNNKPA